MIPTLRIGDELKVESYYHEEILIGDIVVFRSKTEEREIVHRIISISESCCINTMGDNNQFLDSQKLHREDIIGRVVSIKRHNKELSIHRGLKGSVYGYYIRKYNLYKRVLLEIFKLVFHSIPGKVAIIKLLPPSYKRIVSFKRPNGTELQFLIGNKIVARRLPKMEHWQINRPFSIIINNNKFNPEDLCIQVKRNQ